MDIGGSYLMGILRLCLMCIQGFVRMGTWRMMVMYIVVLVVVGLEELLCSCLNFGPARVEQWSYPPDFADSSLIHPQPFLVHCYRFLSQ